jgi:hypothetical protein
MFPSCWDIHIILDDDATVLAQGDDGSHGATSGSATVSSMMPSRVQ